VGLIPQGGRRSPRGLYGWEKNRRRFFTPDRPKLGHGWEKSLLTPDLASALAEKVAAGETVETASSSLGLSSRSVRRSSAEGEQELGRLSAEARLALELTVMRMGSTGG
jgi:hypothetical protein